MNIQLRSKFEDIYNNNTWESNESVSGLGSTLEFTENIRNFLPNFIKENNINRMLDTSCGDWNWMRIIKDDLCDYTGIDIVPAVIEQNNTLYSNSKTKFINNDILTFLKSQEDQFFDLILCRHTLEHLPTDYNLEVIEEFKRVGKYLLLTTHNLCSKNIELNNNNNYRPINLKLEPYFNNMNVYFNTSIYDGPTSHYPEMYINLYNFTNGEFKREILDFRYITNNDIFDNSYPHWSRKWEYPVVKHICRDLLKNIGLPKIHNSSWGFDTDHHRRFKQELEKEYGFFNVLNTDILCSEDTNTEVYNVLESPPYKYLNSFDCVINISAIEEIQGDHIRIIENLFSQVKPNGFLIITFDLPGMQLTKLEDWLGRQISLSNWDNRIIGNGQWFEGLNVGLLVLKKVYYGY